MNLVLYYYYKYVDVDMFNIGKIPFKWSVNELVSNVKGGEKDTQE